MKKALLSFINNPVKVGVASLGIALIIGAVVWHMAHTKPAQVFASAAAGALSLAGDAVADSNTQHLTLSFLVGGQVDTVAVKVGDTVHSGDTLATLTPDSSSGTLVQAQGALASAQANYQKVINGASGLQIDAAKAAVATAQTNVTQTQNQQNTLVTNARRKLYSDNLVAIPSNNTPSTEPTPLITGAYNGAQSGQYTLSFGSINDLTFDKVNYAGLESGITDMKDTPQPLGTEGLFISFPTNADYLQDQWTVLVPNPEGINYAANLSAYQSAEQTQTQSVAAAQAALTQAQSNLNVVAAAARPEDVAAAAAAVQSAQGVLQIAQAAYNNRIIHAPGDATIVAVHIAPGTTVTPNAPAIELTGQSFTKEVAVMIPNSAIINRNGNLYVELKTGSSVTERQITTGASDAEHTEVLSGLSVGDQVVTQQ